MTTGYARLSGLLAAISVAVWLGAGPAAAESFAVSTGHVVDLAPPAEMGCKALARKLAEIDATGYRGARPAPANRGDRRLFAYENEVSMRYYSTCAAARGSSAASTNVFRGGFNAPRVRD